MLGTILIVILIWHFLGRCHAGRIAGSGVMPRPAAWD